MVQNSQCVINSSNDKGCLSDGTLSQSDHKSLAMAELWRQGHPECTKMISIGGNDVVLEAVELMVFMWWLSPLGFASATRRCHEFVVKLRANDKFIPELN